MVHEKIGDFVAGEPFFGKCPQFVCEIKNADLRPGRTPNPWRGNNKFARLADLVTGALAA